MSLIPVSVPGDESEERPGTVQSVRRAAAILRALARGPAEGARLKDLAEVVGLDRSTCHRLLATLAGEGLVEQDISSTRYQLGLDFFALASAASNRYDVQDVAQSSVRDLAQLTSDTVFFSLRSGYDAICVDVNTGAYPVKTLPVDVGARNPLGADATGVAFLAPLPDAEIRDVLHHNAPRLAKHAGYSIERTEAAIARFRDVGFAFDDGRTVHGIHTIALPIADRRGRPLSVLTVAAIGDRMPPSRRPTIAAAIQAEGIKIYEAMMRLPDANRHRHSWLPKQNPAFER